LRIRQLNETTDNLGKKVQPVSPRRLEPGAPLWVLRTWRCLFTGTAVLLYAGEAKVASVLTHDRRVVESIAGKWQRAVHEIVRLEKPAGPKT
jgi:hypothetical protein